MIQKRRVNLSGFSLAVRVRFAFIDAHLETYGRVNRADISEAFDMSDQQASNDLSNFKWLWPQRMIYDPSAKAYLPAPGTGPVTSPAQRTAALTLKLVFAA